MTATQRICVWLVGIRGGAEDRLSPRHKKRFGTNDETSQVSAQKFTVLRLKNWSCKCMKTIHCDSDENNVTLFTVINTFYTCQADVETKTVGVLLCVTQNGETCTVGTFTCLSCEEAPRCTSMICFSCNTSNVRTGTSSLPRTVSRSDWDLLLFRVRCDKFWSIQTRSFSDQENCGSNLGRHKKCRLAVGTRGFLESFDGDNFDSLSSDNSFDFFHGALYNTKFWFRLAGLRRLEKLKAISIHLRKFKL